MPRIITLQGVSGDVANLPNGDKVIVFTDQVTGDVTQIPCGDELSKHIGSKLLLSRPGNGGDPSVEQVLREGKQR